MVKLKEKYVYLLIIVLAFIIYGNTIMHDYALDDAIVITENQFTKQGLSGIKDILKYDSFTGFYGVEKKLVSGGRYRPISIITFAIEYELFGLNPHISHSINILLYAFIGMLIYSITRKTVFRKYNGVAYFHPAILTALIFLVHPVHTEVVANIKGRDEILALLGSLLAFHFFVRYLENRNAINIVVSVFIFLLALLSKENAISFLVITPFAVNLFKDRDKKYKKDTLTSVYVFIIPAIVFLYIRARILMGQPIDPPKELLNNPFLEAAGGEKFATIFYTLLIYLKLLFFPYPLTYDYYPYHIELMNWNNWQPIVSVVIYSIMIAYAGIRIWKRDILAFSIMVYLVPLFIVSNILFPVGSFMNERFLFFSSLGFAIFLSWLLIYKVKLLINSKYVISGILIILFIVFSVRSIDRNRDWKDNFTLFTHDVQISQNSAKGNCSAGGILSEKAKELDDQEKANEYYQRAYKYLTRSLEIYPQYTDALILLGNLYYDYKKDVDSALLCYYRILENGKGIERVYNNMEIVIRSIDDPDQKIDEYIRLLKYQPERFNVLYQLGLTYGKEKGNFNEAIKYFQKALQINPEHIGALKDLGVVYGMNQQFRKSIEITNRAIEIAPKDKQLYVNQGINYRSLGNLRKAEEYFQKASELGE